MSIARVTAMWVHRALGIHHRASRIVTPTDFLRTKLVDNGFDGAIIRHVPTFVESKTFVPDFSEYNNEIVVAGRLATEKGPETAIDAMGQLDATSRLKLVFLGDGHESYVAALRARADAVAPGRVEFTGWVEREELIGRLGRARALLIPARWYENMPNAVTEAMALGRPVLASNIGSLPEQVIDGQTGQLLPFDDPSVWASAITRLEQDEAIVRSWGRAGHDRVTREFTPALHYERLMKVFHEAREASGRGRHPA